MNYKKTLILLLLLAFFAITNAQIKNIVVISTIDNTPIEAVSVSTSPGNSSSVTNVDGRVEFSNLKLTDTLIFDNFDIIKTKILAGNLKSDTVFIKNDLIELDEVSVSAFNKVDFFSKLLEGIPKYYDKDMNLYGVIREKYTINDTIHRLLETSTLLNIDHYWYKMEPINKKISVENYNQKYFRNDLIGENRKEISPFLHSVKYYQNMILGDKIKLILANIEQLKLKSKEVSENGDIRMKFVSDTLDYPFVSGAKFYTELAIVVDSEKSKVLNLDQDIHYFNTKMTTGRGKQEFDQDIKREQYSLNFKYDKENKLILNNYNYSLNSILTINNKIFNCENDFNCTIFEQIPPDSHSINGRFKFDKSLEDQIQFDPDKISSSKTYFPLSEEEQEFIGSQ